MNGLGQVDQRGAGGRSVDEGDPKEQEARGKGPHQEVLQGGLGSSEVVPSDAGQHVDRDRHGLEAESYNFV